MGAFRHFLIVVAVAFIFRWMWKSSRSQKASVESGRLIFPPGLPIRIFVWSLGIIMAFLALLTTFREGPNDGPNAWWVPLGFVGLFALAPLMYPPVLVIDVSGIESRSRFGANKKILWHEIASLHYNTGIRKFKIRSRDGRTIAHAGLNVDQARFTEEIQRRTGLDVKVDAELFP